MAQKKESSWEELVAEYFPPAPIERNERAERLQVYLATREAVLNGELGHAAAVEAMVAAGWPIDRAQFHVDAWEALSLMRLMHGERKSDPLRVVRLQVTDLEQMAKLLNIPDVSEEAYGEASDEAS
jgi:hypothetical protein